MKMTPEGIAVLEADTHISRWVEQKKTLAHDGALLPQVLRYLHPGDTVIDVGAFIGDHTAAYLKAVGDTGVVWAFEPNPKAYECLLVNCPQARCRQMALGAQPGYVQLLIDKNAGASCTTPSEQGIQRITLDSLGLDKLNLMKIDAEGDECQVLLGARETIMRYLPILVLEVNEHHLMRQGDSRARLYSILEGMGYGIEQITGLEDPAGLQFDIVCKPRAGQSLVDANKQAFLKTWPGGYTENWSVYQAATGISESHFIKVCLEPFYNREHVAMEIGCGTGFWVDRYLAPNFKQVIALDLLPRPAFKSPNVTYIEVPDRDFDCYGVEDGSVDFAWSFGMFCHITQPSIQRYLNAIFRKLRPSGRAVLYFSNTERRRGTATQTNTQDCILWVANDWPTTEIMLRVAGFTGIHDLLPKHLDTIAYAEKPR